MADAGQHGGALLDLTGDAVTHVEKGAARQPHLGRTARPEVADVATRADALCGLGQFENGRRSACGGTITAMPRSSSDETSIHSRMTLVLAA